MPASTAKTYERTGCL